MNLDISPVVIAAGAGVLFAAAVLLIISAFTRAPAPQLPAALTGLRTAATRLSEPAITATAATRATGPVFSLGAGATTDRGDQQLSALGSWCLRVFRLSPTPELRAQLELRNASLSYFYGLRAAWAIGGFVIPTMLFAILSTSFNTGVSVPAGICVLAAVSGWFWPVLTMRRMAGGVNVELNASLLVFIDLVTLERLSNAAAANAVENAALLSDQPLFRQIRVACDRARLQQEPPWPELLRLSGQLNLPALTDIVKIVQQDDGAPLNAALRARVKDLRNEWISDQLAQANRLTTRMTFFMTIPTLVIGAIIVVPAVLALA